MRIRRPLTLYADALDRSAAPGKRPVRGLQAYSRTRWVGEASTIVAMKADIPAVRHTLFANSHSANPFDVPDGVTEALQAPIHADAG